MYNNFTQSKKQHNGRLLTLLTNRSRARSVPNIRSDWPGLFNANFATNIKHNQSNNNNIDQKLLRRSASNYTSSISSIIPITPVTITQQLSLKPDLSNKITYKRQFTQQSHRFNTTSRSNRNNNNRVTSVIRIQQNNQDNFNITKSTIFKNSTINNRVNQIIDKQAYYTAKQKVKQNVANIINQRTFLQSTIKVRVNFKQKKSLKSKEKVNDNNKIQRGSNKSRMNKDKFKIDFFTFGYIEKVINNPQLWSKYVHKINNNKQNQQQKEYQQTTMLTQLIPTPININNQQK